MTVSFLTCEGPISQTVLVDSGADANFMDSDVAKSLGLKFVPLSTRFKATSLDGTFLWALVQQTLAVTMIINSQHMEKNQLLRVPATYSTGDFGVLLAPATQPTGRLDHRWDPF